MSPGEGLAAPAAAPEAVAADSEAPVAGKGGDEEQTQEPEQQGGAPAGGGSNASGCSLQLAEGAAPQAFDGCQLVKLADAAMNVMWRAEPVAGNPAVRGASCCAMHCCCCSRTADGVGRKLSDARIGIPFPCSPALTPLFILLPQRTLLTVGMNATGASGYVAVGFPVRPRSMPGATAMVLSGCSGAGCASGAQLRQFYLGGKLQSGEGTNAEGAAWWAGAWPAQPGQGRQRRCDLYFLSAPHPRLQT